MGEAKAARLADGKPETDAKAAALPIGEGEEVVELSDEEKEAVPTRSDE